MNSISKRARYGSLFKLAIRRGLAPGGAVMLLVSLGILGCADWLPSALGPDGAGTQDVGRGLERQALWSFGLFALYGWTAWHGASTLHRWRTTDWAWLGARPTHPYRAWVTVWAGGSCGLGVLLVLMAGVIELSAGKGQSTLALASDHNIEYALPPDGLIPPGKKLQVTWSLPPPGSGQLRLFLRSAPGADPTTDAQLSAHRAGPGTTVIQRIDGRRPLELSCHENSSGPLHITIANIGGGYLAVDPDDSLQWWKPAGMEGRVSVAMVWRAFWGLAGLFALTMGFGGSLSPLGSATLGLTLILAACTWGCELRYLPLVDLAQVLDIMADRRLPAPAHPWLPWLSLALGLTSWVGIRRVN